MLADLLTVAVLGFIGYRLVGAARVTLRRRSRWRRIVRGIRWRHVWPVPFVLTGVVVVAVPLVQLPVLRVGWWTALGGTGNPVTGGTDRTSGTALAWLVPAVFLALVFPSLPTFAEAEERIFRRGAERWSNPKRVARALRFGLVHVVIGIPIGVGVALTVGGLYFTRCYLRGWRASGGNHEEALLESTRAHTAYNAVVLSVAIVALVAGALAG